MEHGFTKEFQTENLLREFISYKKSYKIEEVNMNKEEFLNYITDFAANTLWSEFNEREQLRALFTSYCLVYRVDTDTKECDGILFIIREALEFQADVEAFENYMIELIV